MSRSSKSLLLKKMRDRTHARSAALQRVALYGGRLSADDFVCIKSWVLCYHNAKRTIFLTFCPSYGKIGGSENRRAYGR